MILLDTVRMQHTSITTLNSFSNALHKRARKPAWRGENSAPVILVRSATPPQEHARKSARQHSISSRARVIGVLSIVSILRRLPVLTLIRDGVMNVIGPVLCQYYFVLNSEQSSVT
jgi:hypothetical protein